MARTILLPIIDTTISPTTKVSLEAIKQRRHVYELRFPPFFLFFFFSPFFFFMALSTNAESQRELFVTYIKASSHQTTALQPLPVSLFSPPGFI